MKIIILLFGILWSFGLSAQVYTIENGTVNTECSGIFVDSGGDSAPYSQNESFIYTICPSSAGQAVKLEFTDFSTLAGADIMTIYNADDASDPATSFGQFSGDSAAETPGLVAATRDNSSGCLTIQFTSSAGDPSPGWIAEVSCFVPCQSIISQIDTAVPAPNADGFIKVCPNEEITLTGSGQFGSSSAGATYEWDLGNGATQSGQTATVAYDTPGVYIVNLIITDTNISTNPTGCRNTNLINQVIQVSLPTDFSGTAAAASTLCFGESTTIEGIANPIIVASICTPPVSEETFLPDGDGLVYETSIVVDCFNSDQTLDNIAQLIEICLVMEHSYASDLLIEIISPTNETVKLHDRSGGSANLGIPWATAPADNESTNLTPGVGYQYCFVPDTSYPTLGSGAIPGGVFTAGNGPRTYDDNYIPAGTYSSANSLNGLLGATLNGSWTIRVTDNANKDNGYIFSWVLNFDSSIQPPALSFTPTIISESWDANSTIIDTTGNTITVQPPTEGTHCYTYRAMDDFGCEYSEEVCIDVAPELIFAAPNDLFVCNTGAATSVFDLTQNTAVIMTPTPNPADFDVSYFNSQADADANTDPISSADTTAFSGSDGQIVYGRFEHTTSSCFETVSFILNLSAQPSIFPAQDIKLCDDSTNDGFEMFTLLDQTAEILGAQPRANYVVTYHLSFSDADAGVSALPDNYQNTSSPQPIYVRVEGVGDSGCSIASSTPVFNLVINNKATVSPLSNLEVCDDDSDGFMSFDLESQTSIVLGAQVEANFTVTYHATQDDADAAINALTSPYINTLANQQKIYPRVIENIANACYETTEFDLIVTPLPTINVMSSMAVCDASATGYSAFNLISMDAEAMNGQTGMVVSYHESQLDAEAGQNALSSPYTNTTVDTQMVYICLENTTTGCSSSMPLQLVVSPLPIPNTPPLQTVCDDDFDGFSSFDFTGLDVFVIGSQTDMVVSYHTSQSDADSNVNALSSPYINTIVNSQTLIVRLERVASGCHATTTLELVVDPLPVIPAIANFVVCDDTNAGDLKELFDLTTKDTEIINGQNASVAYYEIESDAINEVNSLTSPYENTSRPETLYVSLTDLTTGCRSIGSFVLEVNPLPQLINPTVLEVCDDGNPDGLTLIDLSQKDDEIRGGNVNYSINYYLTQLDADAETNALTIPYTNISNPQTIIARGQDINTGCFATVTLDLSVSQAPIASSPRPIEYCDPDNDGFGVFTLTDVDLEITAGATGLVISYHETLTDAENSINALLSPYTNTVVNAQTLFARVETASAASDCSTIVDVIVAVFPTPQLVNPTPLQLCDDNTDQLMPFNLTSTATEFLNGIRAADVTISYYETQTNAENETNAIAVPADYTNLTNPQTVWIRVANIATDCEKITSLELVVNPLPVLIPPTPLVLCDDNFTGDEREDFTLENSAAQILNGQTGLDVSYHLTQTDAEGNLSPLLSPYTNVINPQTVFARLTNPITGCYDFTPLTLEVLPIPVSIPPVDLEACDDTLSGDRQEIFDLRTNELVVLNGQLGVTATYYETLLDAQDGTNVITDPVNYTNTNNPTQTIFVRVADDITGCHSIVDFDVIVLPIPEATAVPDLLVCELNTDDVNAFDLETQSGLIRGSQDATAFLVTFHTSVSDAASGTNALLSPYSNISNPQTIFASVTNVVTGCKNTVVNFDLEIFEAAQASTPTDTYAVCDDMVETDGDPSNDRMQFDLSTQDIFVLNGQNSADYSVRYFASQSDADSNINELLSPYINTMNPQIIIARVDNDTQVTGPSGVLVDVSICYETAPVTLVVNPLPIIDIESDYILCVDTNGTEVLEPLDIDTGLSTVDHTFIWKDSTGAVVGTDSNYKPTAGGTYTLEVFDATQVTTCAAPIQTFIVTESAPPTVTAVVSSEAFADTHIVVAVATGIGTYEYSLDFGPWQDSGTFLDVLPGERVITARDLNGCGEAQAVVYVIDYPKYFTPNGDGYHDTWNIVAVESQANSLIRIFDRYGKLLKQIHPSADGWDGTFNGALMPSSDYWFILEYNDPTSGTPAQLKAHFSLKR